MGCFSCPLASFWVASTQIADERPFEGEPWIASRARILLLPGAAGAGLRLPAKGRSSTICVEVTQKQSKARPRKVLLPGSAGASARRGQPSSARGGRGRAGAHPRRRRAVDPHRRLLQHLRARARVSGGSRLAPRGVGWVWQGGAKCWDASPAGEACGQVAAATKREKGGMLGGSRGGRRAIEQVARRLHGAAGGGGGEEERGEQRAGQQPPRRVD